MVSGFNFFIFFYIDELSDWSPVNPVKWFQLDSDLCLWWDAEIVPSDSLPRQPGGTRYNFFAKPRCTGVVFFLFCLKPHWKVVGVTWLFPTSCLDPAFHTTSFILLDFKNSLLISSYLFLCFFYSLTDFGGQEPPRRQSEPQLHRKSFVYVKGRILHRLYGIYGKKTPGQRSKRLLCLICGCGVNVSSCCVNSLASRSLHHQEQICAGGLLWGWNRLLWSQVNASTRLFSMFSGKPMAIFKEKKKGKAEAFAICQFFMFFFNYCSQLV